MAARMRRLLAGAGDCARLVVKLRWLAGDLDRLRQLGQLLLRHRLQSHLAAPAIHVVQVASRQARAAGPRSHRPACRPCRRRERRPRASGPGATSCQPGGRLYLSAGAAAPEVSGCPGGKADGCIGGCSLATRYSWTSPWPHPASTAANNRRAHRVEDGKLCTQVNNFTLCIYKRFR